MDRSHIQPILDAVPAARQKDARHYGVHPYFTRRPSNVVRAYIERYSVEGDVVCDPFGGTGVTAIEAYLLGRNAIHNDINPFANFLVRCISDLTLSTNAPICDGFARVEKKCEGTLKIIESDEAAASKWLKKLPLPENIRLPRNSDAEFYYDMFTPKQLAGLALLKKSIDEETAGPVRDALLLAWSASIAKLNKTFLSAKGRAESRGGSSIFSIYRYKIASQCIELPIWQTFAGRFQNVLEAKDEMLQHREYLHRTGRTHEHRQLTIFAHDAADLTRVIVPGSVDYIFTDPPYGGFISYLDLSILWNHWLGFPVESGVRERETIVGGELNHSEDHYKESLAQSIRTCFQLLRPDRWLSIVFQHWDLSYFATILETASECGGELKAAITQTGDVIWSMHKKKNSASLLAGELILTFYKPVHARLHEKRPRIASDFAPEKILSDVFDECLMNGMTSFTSEALFNRLVVQLWRRNALSCLSLDRRAFAEHLECRGWTYDPQNHLWTKHPVPEGCLL